MLGKFRLEFSTKKNISGKACISIYEVLGGRAGLCTVATILLSGVFLQFFVHRLKPLVSGNLIDFEYKNVRIALDIACVALGVMLGGRAGLCTVATILLSGLMS